MDQRTSRFLARIPRIDDPGDLNAAFRVEARAQGFTAYAAGQILPYDPDMPFYLLDWPQRWLQLYAAEGFAQEDVALVVARRETRTFTWAELRAYSPGASGRVFAACEAFGWRDGLVIPVRGPGRARGVFSLAASARLALTPDARNAIELMAVATYARARELAGQSRPRAGALSPREREALAAVAQGKSDADIAALLGVSRTTAHAHVERAKSKLGAATRAQAVALALLRGALSLMHGIATWPAGLFSE